MTSLFLTRINYVINIQMSATAVVNKEKVPTGAVFPTPSLMADRKSSTESNRRVVGTGCSYDI
jgi:hypothetical protein